MRRAFILAGGLGTRLLPYTTVLPKPLLSLGQRSILEHLLEGVAASGLTRATISLGHLVEAVIGDGSRYRVDVDYTHESSSLGTEGALRLIPDPRTDDHIVVLKGDTYTDLLYSKGFDEKSQIGFLNCFKQADTEVGVCRFDHALAMPFAVVVRVEPA